MEEGKCIVVILFLCHRLYLYLFLDPKGLNCFILLQMFNLSLNILSIVWLYHYMYLYLYLCQKSLRYLYRELPYVISQRPPPTIQCQICLLILQCIICVPINTIIDAIITTTKISWWYHSLPIIFPDLPHASKCVFINTLNDAIITKKNFMVIIIQCQVCLLIFQCIIICPHRHIIDAIITKKIHEDNHSVPNMCPDLPMHHNVSQSTQLLMQSSQKKEFHDDNHSVPTMSNAS